MSTRELQLVDTIIEQHALDVSERALFLEATLIEKFGAPVDIESTLGEVQCQPRVLSAFNEWRRKVMPAADLLALAVIH
jgi:hypothetical protein